VVLHSQDGTTLETSLRVLELRSVRPHEQEREVDLEAFRSSPGRRAAGAQDRLDEPESQVDG
jgi:hypothetical protein